MTSVISSAYIMSVCLLLVTLAITTNAEKSSISTVENGGTLNKIQELKLVDAETNAKAVNLDEVDNSNPQMEIERLVDEEADDEVEHDENDDEDEEDDEDEAAEHEDGDSELEVADREADIDNDDYEYEAYEDDHDDAYGNNDDYLKDEHEVEIEGINADTAAGKPGNLGATTNVEAAIKTDTVNKEVNMLKN